MKVPYELAIIVWFSFIDTELVYASALSDTVALRKLIPDDVELANGIVKVSKKTTSVVMHILLRICVHEVVFI